MHALQNGFLGALCVLLSLAPMGSHGAEPAAVSADCQGHCASASLLEHAWQPASAYPRSLALPRGLAVMIELDSYRPDPMLAWQPPDTHWLTKLKGIKELRLLTLWESDGTRLFLGVSNRGLPGIAFSSRRPATKKKRRGKDESWRLHQDSLIYY